MSDIVQRLRARQAPVGIDKDAAGFVVHHAQDALCSEAADEIERLRKDAERYRWLRDVAPAGAGDMASVRDSHTPEEVDAAIDAAMQAKEGA